MGDMKNVPILKMAEEEIILIDQGVVNARAAEQQFPVCGRRGCEKSRIHT